MKIGILQTGETPAKLRGEHGNYPAMFKKMFARAGVEGGFVVYDSRRGRFPKTPDVCDGYIITGSKHGVYEPLPWIAELLENIRALHRARAPLVGVCFGHQAIAQALGGKVIKSPKGWGLGLHSWQVVRAAPWMSGAKKQFSLLSFHQDQVVKLPRGAVRLFGSAFCPNAGFAVGARVFSMQGHPEFVPGFCRDLTSHRADSLPPDAARAATRSAGGRNDSVLCAKWMRAFFDGAK